MRNLKYFQWLLWLGMTLGLIACSAGGGPGAVGPTELSPLTTSNNAATPMQISGTSRPNVDPPATFTPPYQAKFDDKDLLVGKTGIKLSGKLLVTPGQEADFIHKILKVIDRRAKKYAYVELDTSPADTQSAQFSVELPVASLSIQELLQGETLSFFVLNEQALGNLDFAVLSDCETAPCIESVQGMVKIIQPPTNGSNEVEEKIELPEPMVLPDAEGNPGSYVPNPWGLGKPPEKINKPGS